MENNQKQQQMVDFYSKIHSVGRNRFGSYLLDLKHWDSSRSFEDWETLFTALELSTRHNQEISKAANGSVDHVDSVVFRIYCEVSNEKPMGILTAEPDGSYIWQSCYDTRKSYARAKPSHGSKKLFIEKTYRRIIKDVETFKLMNS